MTNRIEKQKKHLWSPILFMTSIFFSVVIKCPVPQKVPGLMISYTTIIPKSSTQKGLQNLNLGKTKQTKVLVLGIG